MKLTIPDFAIDSIEHLSSIIGIAPEFFPELLEEDDWSFVIKMHALLESTISHVLTLTAHNEVLGDIFARLELSNKSVGKLAFLKAYDMVDKHERRLMSELSELRNHLVHRIENITFTFEAYLSSSNHDKTKVLANTFAAYVQ